MPVLCWQLGMWFCSVSAFVAWRQADMHLFAILRHCQDSDAALHIQAGQPGMILGFSKRFMPKGIVFSFSFIFYTFQLAPRAPAHAQIFTILLLILPVKMSDLANAFS